MTTEEDRIAEATLRLAGRKNWRSLALADIAEEAGIALAELAAHYPSKPAILDGFERMIDRRMLAGASSDTSEPARDRLLGIIMERFDALQPYRDGVRHVAREAPLDPSVGLVLACALPRSISWMLAGARVPSDGPTALVRIAVLGVAYVAAFRAWLTDDNPDLGKTMAALDRALDRASSMLGGDIESKNAAGSDSEPAEMPPPVLKPQRRQKGTGAGRRKPAAKSRG